MRNHGTAPYTLGQYNEVLISVERALPKVLEGTDPKRIIKAVQNGEEVEKVLAHALAAVLKEELPSQASGRATKAKGILTRAIREIFVPLPKSEPPCFPNYAFQGGKKEDWTLVTDVSEPRRIPIADLEIVCFHEDYEDAIAIAAIIERADEMGANLGERHARYLLQHQEEIPKEWRDKLLVFPRTLWSPLDNNRYMYMEMPYLCWQNDQWFLNFFQGMLSRQHHPSCFVRLRKPA